VKAGQGGCAVREQQRLTACESWAGWAWNMPHFIYLKMVPQLPFNHLSSLAL